MLSFAFPKIPIGFKVFGMATGMMVFTIAVVYVSYSRIDRVNKELIDIADYLIPLTAHKTQIDAYARLQEIHFERALRLYEIDGDIDREKIRRELEQFEMLGESVDREFETAIASCGFTN